jgi:hypothetical protein
MFDSDLVVTVSFRDGDRDIPRYLADMMATIDTIRFTYTQAVEEANQKALADRINLGQRRLIAEHFSRNRGYE